MICVSAIEGARNVNRIPKFIFFLDHVPSFFSLWTIVHPSRPFSSATLYMKSFLLLALFGISLPLPRFPLAFDLYCVYYMDLFSPTWLWVTSSQVLVTSDQDLLFIFSIHPTWHRRHSCIPFYSFIHLTNWWNSNTQKVGLRKAKCQIACINKFYIKQEGRKIMEG